MSEIYRRETWIGLTLILMKFCDKQKKVISFDYQIDISLLLHS